MAGGREDLLRERAKIIAMLPLTTGDRRFQLSLRLERIQRELGLRSKKRAEDYRSETIERAASGISGIGALGFGVNAPPGRGRLVRLPMYLDTTPAAPAGGDVTTDGGTGALALVNPAVIVRFNTNAVPAAIVTGMRLSTREVPWAKSRIVGFEVTQRYTAVITVAHPLAPPAGPTLAANQYTPVTLVRNLTVGGGANLFPHETYVDGVVYAAKVPEFPGLRDNPILNPDNTVTVWVACIGYNDGGASPGSAVTYSCSLVCEILEDDEYGAPIPGPYSRSHALARDTSEDGGGFVEG